MSDLNFIDSYFKKELTPEEISDFEQKINEDPAFAQEVAFYCIALQTIKNELADKKKIQFRKIYDQNKIHDNKAAPSMVKKLWPYIAAAAVAAGLIFGLYLYLKPSSPQQLADQYIKQNFEKAMGVKMAGREDSLDAAIRLYNEDKLTEALQQFDKIIQTDSIADIAKKMAGIVSLRTRDYDKAIGYFTQLEKVNLYSNPGKFFHALALIKRNQPDDKRKAKQLLQQVIDMDLEGKETAQEWIRLF